MGEREGAEWGMDPLDRRIVLATQEGLPLVPEPYRHIAGQLGVTAEEVMERHGRDRKEVEAKVATIADMLGEHSRGHEILFSTRILKKTGLRIPSGPGGG